MKDFNEWNKQKIKTQREEQNRWCQPRDIWWCSLGVNVGYEQDGKGTSFLRPVVILRSFGIHTALVVPLTTSKKKNMYHVSLGTQTGVQSYAIVTQIRLIDTKRLFEKRGKVDEKVFEIIKEAIKTLF